MYSRTEGTLTEEDQEDIVAKLLVMMLSISWKPAAALRTIVELNIPHILATHASALKHSMTTEELIKYVPGSSKPNARNLGRTMRLLTCKSIFSEKVENIPRGKSLLLSEDAFGLAQGMNVFDYMNTHPDHLSCFQAATSDHANQLLPMFLAKYQGFEGLRKLMDMGGGEGTILARILARQPHTVQGVNFDLLEIVATASCHPGVEHVGGDRFKSIPTGCDAIFMQSIMHDWNDEDCLTILQNCYNALPVGGKVIMVDVFVPFETTNNPENYEDVGTFMSDFLMQVHSLNGRERQQHEFQHLVTAAGFSNFKVLVQLDYMFVMEGVKELVV